MWSGPDGPAAPGEAPTAMTARPTNTGALLLDEVGAMLDRFCVLPSAAARDAAVLWIAHTHVRDIDRALAFDATPRLAILSTGPQSGKTRLLELVTLLTCRGDLLADPSAYAMLQSINEDAATLAIDEIDVLFGRGAGARTTRTVLNSGYKPGAHIKRLGKDQSCYAPVVLAGMGANFRTNAGLAALRTRSVEITMRPKRADEQVDHWRPRLHDSAARQLSAALTSWGRQVARRCGLAWPVVPDGVTDRLEELWTPLLAVGEECGEEWTVRAQAACRALALADVDDTEELTESPLELLLGQLAQVFAQTEDKEIATGDVLQYLSALPARWGADLPVRAAAMELSRTLAAVGVGPVKLWRDGRHIQAYTLEQLEPVFDEHDPEWRAGGPGDRGTSGADDVLDLPVV